ncbi:DegT/DnrJ/EryC1/StrS family aminotransferase [Chryseobacterium salivictor]|uniref:UDP-4-amino-4-deoxy-L-arabinose--oxoglutarate aminotransferase n=1 Tax=Chryseobacterium salivictor TaxID=2547600 RepID=A0A4P6ZCL6_9FLAO|nr:DegT/DnrJ/EryC1/StrS family aminotransferase [Chryseobacterium salivictor]QBO57197.1 UDP-4-amino-4-deoxy-L-arabinose--oxoglutarate aminotransferase [Chryseobacterium salivictor]
MKISFAPPFIDEDIIAEVVNTLKSGWITTGPKVKALEEEVAKLTGVPHVLCVNSWTSGAILILKWFGIKEGDEVIIPAYTYSATALAVLHCGGTPVMVDVKDDFTVDPEKIRQAITEKTKVIMPVDIAGLPCDYDSINQMVNLPEIKSLFHAHSENQKKLGRILILSDAAHSVGAFYNNKPAGSLTDITIFSFHAVKNITTAEGGAICINLPKPFNNEEEYKTMRLWTLNGQTKDAFTKSQGGGSSWKYDIIFQGLKINMPDICAALGLAQIRKYNTAILPERKRVAEQYHEFFSKREWAQLPITKDDTRTSSFHLYALRINNITEEQRDTMMISIAEDEVAVNVHFIPMPLLTLFKDLGYRIDDYPNAYHNYSREISLPIYPQLTAEQIDFICKSVEKAYKKII